MEELVIVSPSLVQRYGGPGPRYTSYPTADRFSDGFRELEYRNALERNRDRGRDQPVSVYLHVPFCPSGCWYCACNKVVTRHRPTIDRYLATLHREVESATAHLDRHRPIGDLHLGGGTPTTLGPDGIEAWLETINTFFRPGSADGFEASIEVDPRESPPGLVTTLRQLGFDRISLGVQDFDPRVQAGIHRVQPIERTEAVVEEARAVGFSSVGFDLVYGLPHQRPASFQGTLDEVIRLGPDRLSVFRYAHLPARFPAQRKIDASALPSPQTCLKLFADAVERLTSAGYVHIGMDHFARANDGLARAQGDGTLHRNFMGYTTRAARDVIAFGVTGISCVDDVYAQNVGRLSRYQALVESGRLPIERGTRLTPDDRRRRRIIDALMCRSSVDLDTEGGGADRFRTEFEALVDFERDGLLRRDGPRITLTDLGRLFVRAVCRVFDRYASGASKHSRVA